MILLQRSAAHALVVAALSACINLAQADETVKLSRDGERVVVTIGDAPFAQYQTSRDQARPYFSEVRGPDGVGMSRPISPPGGDHAHHTGIWIAVDKVGGVDFWHEEQPIVNQQTRLLVDEGNPAVLEVINHWMDDGEKPLIVERTRIRIFGQRLLIYDITLEAADKDVTFGDTEEGFFAFRMVDSMCEEETGQVVNADGRTTAKGCWGRTSNWVDYSGNVEGRTCGVAMFDHPQNFRPSRYHVRDYGLFTISPFGEGDYSEGRWPALPVTIPAGKSLRLRYGMYFHAGDVVAGRVADVYQDFLRETGAGSAAETEIQFRSSADGTIQPAMFVPGVTEQPVPLLVALHTWSGDYQQDNRVDYVEWCQEKGWACIHPDSRGPNRHPDATGSDLVVQDIVDAVEYAKRRTNVDPNRVYLVGASGGGYTALLMAARRPDLWAGVSAWVPIVDLQSWYDEDKARGNNHWPDIVRSCGGPPGTSDQVDDEYRRRSPITWLNRARGVNIDINAGIRDGHEGSVPVSHSLRAFNEIALPPDRFTEEEIQHIVREATIPPHLQHAISDPEYGQKKPLLRRQSSRVRVTLFDGGHELIPKPALGWLTEQRR